MENDFGFVHIPKEQPVEQASEKKSASKVTQRSIIKKEKVEQAIDPNRVANTATTISNALPLEVPSFDLNQLVDEYGKPLGTLGLLGLAAHKLLSGGNPSEPVPPTEAKPDLRNFGQAPITPAAPAAPAEPPIPKGWEDIIAKSNANAAAKAADAAAKANPVPAGYQAGIPNAVSPMSQLTAPQAPAPQAPAPQGGFDPSRIGQPLQDPLAGGGWQQPAQEIGPRPSVSEAVATGGNVDQAVKQTVADLVDEKPVAPLSQPEIKSFTRDAKGNIQWPKEMSPAAKAGAELFAQQYPDHAQKLAAEGKFAIMGGGAADNNLFNAYGKELRKTILNEVNQGQMGGAYSNYIEKINPALKALPQEAGLGKTLADLRVNNPEGALHGPLGVQASIGKAGELVTKPGAPSKLIKAGGPALLLMSIADAAKAAQQGNMAPSKELGFDLGTGALLTTLLGGPAAAVGAMALGSTGLNSDEQQKLDYLRKVGAGRGIAPPSAYR